MDDRSLLEQVLQAWRVNNAINLKLVSAIPKKGFDAVPLASRGRTVAKQLAHMQKVHSGWLKYNSARLSRDARPLHRSANQRINFFQGKPIRSDVLPHCARFPPPRPDRPRAEAKWHAPAVKSGLPRHLVSLVRPRLLRRLRRRFSKSFPLPRV